jgi:hypothetical protein
VDIDELRQHKLDLVFREQGLRFGCVHWFTICSSSDWRYEPKDGSHQIR